MSRFSGTTCLARLAQEPSAASGELGHVTPNLPKRCSLQGRGAAPHRWAGAGGLHRRGRLGKKLLAVFCTACLLTMPALASAGEGIENAAWVLD